EISNIPMEVEIIDLSDDQDIEKLLIPSGLMIIHGWRLNWLMKIQFYIVEIVEIVMGQQYLQEVPLY
ncbi:12797_t:CDS:1, partial [Entrophospora sp. SA101]